MKQHLFRTFMMTFLIFSAASVQAFNFEAAPAPKTKKHSINGGTVSSAPCDCENKDRGRKSAQDLAKVGGFFDNFNSDGTLKSSSSPQPSKKMAVKPVPSERSRKEGSADVANGSCKKIVGTASWYGPGFAGRPTASGKVFDPNLLTAAHKTLPLGTKVRVSVGQKSVIVLINDRGPYVGGRVIDLSKAAAQKLGLIASGHGQVSISTCL